MDERFHQGIREFNRRFFFEAHDILEDLWHEYREDDRLFLQGLIQVAVGCYHLESGNWKGANSQFSKAIAKITPYEPIHQGLVVDELLRDIRRCLIHVEQSSKSGPTEPGPFAFPTIKYSRHHQIPPAS
ncbi:MAG: DUF309 domain-containing protein [Bacteroidota bacterium]